jgi:hypothetical protein
MYRDKRRGECLRGPGGVIQPAAGLYMKQTLGFQLILGWDWWGPPWIIERNLPAPHFRTITLEAHSGQVQRTKGDRLYELRRGDRSPMWWGGFPFITMRVMVLLREVRQLHKLLWHGGFTFWSLCLWGETIYLHESANFKASDTEA